MTLTILYNSISELIETQSEIDLTLTIKFRGVSVELNINESLIVINTEEIFKGDVS
jgi:hypothetical protein